VAHTKWAGLVLSDDLRFTAIICLFLSREEASIKTDDVEALASFVGSGDPLLSD